MIKKNAIFISADRKFLENLNICLFSIQKYYPLHPEIIICYTDLTEQDKIDISKICNNTIFIENNLSEAEVGPVMSHLSNVDPKVFYGRFMLWKEIFFNEYENILHLDADLLVLKDLNYLFRKKSFFIIQEAYKGEDQIFKKINDINLHQRLYKDQISIKNIVGNAGVFLLPKQYRTKENYQELITILHNYKQYIKWADQSIINIWLQKNHINISKLFTYNFQHRLINKHTIIKNIKIIHFNGVNYKYRNECMRYFLGIYQQNKNIKTYLSFYHTLNHD